MKTLNQILKLNILLITSLLVFSGKLSAATNCFLDESNDLFVITDQNGKKFQYTVLQYDMCYSKLDVNCDSNTSKKYWNCLEDLKSKELAGLSVGSSPNTQDTSTSSRIRQRKGKTNEPPASTETVLVSDKGPVEIDDQAPKQKHSKKDKRSKTPKKSPMPPLEESGNQKRSAPTPPSSGQN